MFEVRIYPEAFKLGGHPSTTQQWLYQSRYLLLFQELTPEELQVLEDSVKTKQQEVQEAQQPSLGSMDRTNINGPLPLLLGRRPKPSHAGPLKAGCK